MNDEEKDYVESTGNIIKIDYDLKNNPFINFQSSRYTMSARINVKTLWKYCKKK